MTRSLQRISDFEARSVQIIAAFTLGVAGMSALQSTASQRSATASPSNMSAPAPTTPVSTRNLAQRNAPGGHKGSDRNR